ncbi:excinuclease ABC subunit UvrA [Desulfococcus sp.]|uniref:excinuclease ABC subunit UvrA n=1 Tax=Desulfococcus sp. TaxID=2025834 RepID=UPI003593231C
MASGNIIVQGARQHNLKNIDVEIPRSRLVVVTGLSGSGKSTLAFDTLYAEGQRRYVESLSTYARQFLERMDKPDVDLIEGLSPAIAIQQKTASHNPRSTVGTVTEIHDYLRLLFARIGRRHCHQCGRPVTPQSIDQIVAQVTALPEGTKIIILAPLASLQKGGHEKLLKSLRKQGFSRVRIDGEAMDIENAGTLDKKRRHAIEVIVDRLVVKPGVQHRLADSLELAMAQADGLAAIDVIGGESILFSEHAACTQCGVSFPEISPASFSFNSPQGACPKCNGMGAASEFDPELIVPNPELNLREGAVKLWENRNSVQFMEFLEALTGRYGVDIYTPYQDLPDSFKEVLMHGSGEDEISFFFERKNRRVVYRKRFEGIIPKLTRRYAETDSQLSRDEILQYMNVRPCEACGGCKLNPVSLSVRVGGRNIAYVSRLNITQVREFFSAAAPEFTEKETVIARKILKEIADRLGFLENVGLGYLTLDRSAGTLSGGESQRIRLATQIGAKLTGVLYVLDEPSVGLHKRDNQRLLSTLCQMRDLGNTVLVVEHDEETILAADHVVDMGPGAGARGGEVVFSGPPGRLLQSETSLTGQYLSGKKRIEVPGTRRAGNGRRIVLKGARANNLKGIDVSFPLGSLICVTGVSGSGKSTLVLETLYRVLVRKLYRNRTRAGACDDVAGVEFVDKVIHIDQSPIGRTPRSNPGTYTGVFAPIREIFAETPEARMRGYKAGRFSFNVKGGRCESCQGDGIVRIEMHFLPDVYVTCDVCRGKRYNRETLEVRYKGKNIAEVLHMTVDQALEFFRNIPGIHGKLQTLSEVGLGYIQIGQQGTTLSGGEAQRVKLAKELSRRATGKTVYFLDEPTTGLHMDDIRKLLDVLNRLVDMGNTVIVIEHHLDVIKTADHVIDLGPEGGDGGGWVVASGTPEAVAAGTASHTGRFLRRVLSVNALDGFNPREGS